jgi:hypothetical protein
MCQLSVILQITLYLGKKVLMIYFWWSVLFSLTLMYIFILHSVLVLVGIMICSRIAALSAFVGSAIGAGISWLVGVPVSVIEQGLYGFNHALTFSAMLMFYVPSINSICVGMIASIITVFIQLALDAHLEPYGLPCMVSYYLICYCVDYLVLTLRYHMPTLDIAILFRCSILHNHSRHHFKHDCSPFVFNYNPRRPFKTSTSAIGRIPSVILSYSCIITQNTTKEASATT